MGSLSDYSEKYLMNHILANTAYTPAATVYVGLSTADPLDNATGLAEPVGNNYIRKAITFAAAGSRSIAQTGDVTFNAATGAWGTVSHWALFDAETVGNMLAHGSLSASKAIVSGNTPSIASGQVTVSFNAAGITTYAANKLLDLMFRNTAFTQPVVWAGLAKSSPGDAFTGFTEPSSLVGYNRVSVTVSGSFTSVTTAGIGKNSASIVWPAPSNTWGVITHAFLAGNSVVGSTASGLFYATVAAQEPGSGDTVLMAATAMEITMS